MKLSLDKNMSYDSILPILQEKFPDYIIEKKKNPIAKFEYIQVRKSAFVGLWVRILPNKNAVYLMQAIPGFWARALFGGLLVLLFLQGALRKVMKEVSETLIENYDTKVL